MRSLGLEWLEAGVAGDVHRTRSGAKVAALLQPGLAKHYGCPARRWPRLRRVGRVRRAAHHRAPRLLLQELAQSGYHQYVITHAVRESTAVWAPHVGRLAVASGGRGRLNRKGG